MPQSKPMKWLKFMLSVNLMMMITMIKMMFNMHKLKKNIKSYHKMKYMKMKW